MSDIEKTSMSGIRVSEISQILQDGGTLQLAKEMDSDGDGLIDREDFAAALKSLQASQKENKSLKKIGYGLLSASLLLAGSTVGASVAAARASNDTVVDEGGVLHAKGTGAIVKTQEALDWSKNPDILGMSTRELIGLKDLVLLDGDVHFQIKGFTKEPSQDKVTLLVEGGTVTFGEKGIIDVTGSVIDSYSAVLGSRASDDSQRKLQYGCQGGRCEFECWKKYINTSFNHYRLCTQYECDYDWGADDEWIRFDDEYYKAWSDFEFDDDPDPVLFIVSGLCSKCDDSLLEYFSNDTPYY